MEWGGIVWIVITVVFVVVAVIFAISGLREPNQR
jgi:hypothetical protein